MLGLDKLVTHLRSRMGLILEFEGGEWGFNCPKMSDVLCKDSPSMFDALLFSVSCVTS